MTETLNDRLDRIESEIKSLSDKINHIKPVDINKKEVAKLIDDLSLQIKSINPGVSEDQVKSMLSDLKLSMPKPGLSKKEVLELIDQISIQIKSIKSGISEDRVKSMLSDFKTDTPKPGISKEQVKLMLSDFKPDIPKSGINKEYINEMITDAISKIKPKERDISKEINDVIERDITKEFITGLYRGK